jgi:hypothetical protein
MTPRTRAECPECDHVDEVPADEDVIICPEHGPFTSKTASWSATY